MDSTSQTFQPTPSVSSAVTETQTENMNNTPSNPPAISNNEVRSNVSSTEASASVSRANSIVPASTAVTSAAFVNATTAVPSPPISIAYPPTSQNGAMSATPATNGGSNAAVQKHVLPPPSSTSIPNGMYFN